METAILTYQFIATQPTASDCSDLLAALLVTNTFYENSDINNLAGGSEVSGTRLRVWTIATRVFPEENNHL
jgi:hypothetical protein